MKTVPKGTGNKKPEHGSYEMAKCQCKCGCIKSNGNYIFSNIVWETNQEQMILQNRNVSSEEKTKIMKGILVQKIKEANISSVSSHVNIKIPVKLKDENGKQKTHDFCESCYVNFQKHIKFRTWQFWKQQLKVGVLMSDYAADKIAFLKKKNKDNIIKGKFETIKKAREALKDFALEEEYLQLACVPDTPASLEAYFWLYHFINLVGDHAPNRNEKIQIPGIYTFESIHSIFLHHIEVLYTGNEHEPLQISQFAQLWKNIFPNVSISKYTHVSGKCFCCHALYERQEYFNSERELEIIKNFAAIHKIMIQMQRGAYMKNRQKAMERKELYMSLIIDGMSQDHCVLPYYAGKAVETANELKQKIIGAKQHGISKTFYRTYPYIKSGANLACEVLLREIESRMNWCKANNKKFPRVLFVQIDGGPENSSRTFYALCEDLVRRGVFDHIETSRLPVGHTHEDIDALFGLLWRASRNKTLITPRDWKNMALSAFGVDSPADYHDDEDLLEGLDLIFT